MTSDKDILDAAIKKHRTLYRVAKLMGVHYHTAHAWKKGTAHPQARNLIKLIELAGKSIVAIVMVMTMLLSTGTQEEKASTAQSSAQGLYIMSSFTSKIWEKIFEWINKFISLEIKYF